MFAPQLLQAQEIPEPSPTIMTTPDPSPPPAKTPPKLELPEWRSKSDVNVASSGAKVVQALGICLASLFILLHLYKKLTGTVAPGQRGRVKVIERVPLLGKNVLVLLEVDGKAIVCAVGPDQVTLIHEQSDGVFTDNLVIPDEDTPV